MRERGRGGDGGRDWGNIDWSNIDLSGFGRGGDRITGPSRRVIVLAIVILVLLLIPVLIGPFVSFLTDLLPFRSLGLESVYLRRFTAGFYAFAVFGAVFFVLALPNVYFALRPQMPRVVVDAERRRRGALPMTLRFMWLLLIPAFFFGLAGGDEWDMLLRWVNQVPFGTTDPVFGRDIGFYFFTLPVLEFVRGWLLAAVVLIAIGVFGLYVIRGVIGVATQPLAGADIGVSARNALALARPARARLSIPGGRFLGTPDQLNKERPFIARNIEATRQAYALTAVDESDVDVANDPVESDVRSQFADTTSVRLWDYRPLLAAYKQLQALRQYYAFN